MVRQDETTPGAEEHRTSIPRILLAEDDPDFRGLLASALRQDGYEVLEAETGTELAEILASLQFRHQEPVDLIISDMRMPGFPPLDVLEGFRLALRTPFIVMTAFGSDTMRADARRLGAAYFFDKPFVIEELMEAVSTLAPCRITTEVPPGRRRRTTASSPPPPTTQI